MYYKVKEVSDMAGLSVRLLKIIDTIEATKERFKKGEKMSNKERFDSFDWREIELQREKYAEEVKERWGNSAAYKQSAEKTAKYGPEDYQRIQEESNAIYTEIVSLMHKDVSNNRVQELVDALRQGISKNFYDCDVDTFAGLGEMYVADPRFKKNLDKNGEGFTEYLSKAIAYYSAQKQ